MRDRHELPGLGHAASGVKGVVHSKKMGGKSVTTAHPFLICNRQKNWHPQRQYLNLSTVELKKLDCAKKYRD